MKRLKEPFWLSRKRATSTVNLHPPPPVGYASNTSRISLNERGTQHTRVKKPTFPSGGYPSTGCGTISRPEPSSQNPWREPKDGNNQNTVASIMAHPRTFLKEQARMVCTYLAPSTRYTGDAPNTTGVTCTGPVRGALRILAFPSRRSDPLRGGGSEKQRNSQLKTVFRWRLVESVYWKA